MLQNWGKIIKKAKAIKFISVSIPEYLVKEIEELLEYDPTFRYKSRADFVTTAVREKLEKHQQTKKIIERES